MKIVVLSDSHGFDDRVEKVIQENRDAFDFIHCGDLCSDPNYFPNMQIVRGNNDFFNLDRYKVLEYEGLRFYVTHGDVYSFSRVNYLASKAKEFNCQVVLFGHIHYPVDITIDGIRLLNPGSLLYNRDESKIGYYQLIIKDKEMQVIRKELGE